jgi:glycosyltransferase involved in cell wall biosynthesis
MSIQSTQIIHIITETHGGAGVAARRLHQGLIGLGIDSRLVYRRGYCALPGATRWEPAAKLLWRVREKIERYWMEKRVAPGGGLFTNCRMPFPTTAQALGEPDWPSFFASLPANSPVFLSLHDTTFISGGCHQLDGCEKYSSGCGYCPKLRNPGRHDPSGKIFALKKKLLSRHKLCVAANSSYTLTLAKKSPLLASAAAMEIIHPGVDTTIFKPLDKEFCRQMLQLPNDKVILCFGAASTSYKDKGLDLLTECLNHTPLHEKVFCLVFGAGGERLPEVKCGWRFVGYTDSEHLMAAVYSASDIFVMPSRMETFGLTALEAMACGVPVIASKVGGLVDIILEEKTGFLVPADDYSSWVTAIGRLAKASSLREEYGHVGRERAMKYFDLKYVVQKQCDMYNKYV